MSLWIGDSSERKSGLNKIARVLFLSILTSLLIMAGTSACRRGVEEQQATQEGIINFEGVAKVGIGKYLFVPEVQGFDIIVQGQVDSGDTSALVDKEIRGSGEFSPERPSILVANSIDVKESERSWRNVFNRSDEAVLDDYLDLKTREEFQVLADLEYDKKDGWEGKEKGKVYGSIWKETVTEGGEQKDVYRISILNEKDQEIGKILVDRISDAALFYVKKLSLFEKFWFYVTIKDTVPWRTRQRTSELFHADVLFSGLF